MSNHLASLRERIGHDLIALPAAAAVVLDECGRVLLGKSLETGLWMLPGGALDPDELPANAAVRECWEETGLLIELQRLIGVFGGPLFSVRYANGDAVAYTVIAFAARIREGTLRADQAEFLELGYFRESEILALDIAMHSRVVLERAFARDTPPFFQQSDWAPE